MLFIFFLFHSCIYIFFFQLTVAENTPCGNVHPSLGGGCKGWCPMTNQLRHWPPLYQGKPRSWTWLKKWVTLSSQSHSFHNKFGTFHLEANFTWNLEIVGKRKNTLAVQGTLLGLNLDKSQGPQMELPPLENTPQCVASKEVPALTSQLSVCGKQTWQQPEGPTTPTFF